MTTVDANTPAPARSEHRPAYWIDLPALPVGSKLAITGVLAWRKKYKEKEVVGIRDITGTFIVKLDAGQLDLLANVKKGSRLRVLGVLGLNPEGRPIVDRVDEVKNLGSLNVPLSQLDVEMREQASRMLLSRVVYISASLLRDRHFLEFDSKVISTEWVDGGLEPLRVLYPGFGNPATLATSPSAQVMDFLNATGAPKAFTVSTSFTTTYRYPHSAAETRVIVAKGVDLALPDLQLLVWELTHRILERLGVKLEWSTTPRILDRPWPEKSRLEGEASHINLFHYSSDILTGGVGWRNTSLENVLHVTDASGKILIDASCETIGERVVSGLTIFPSHFLSFLEATPPMRQLRNLGSYNDWIE